MFKVAIIDDEPIIRKGIKNVINWALLDCEVCGEADDGQSGQELIEKFRPEIIITDIRMPEVDGLMMIGRIRDIVPESKIIILTGYRNFEYAQTAIKLGAFDFIMKPSKIEELNNVINRAVSELKNKNQHASELVNLKMEYEKNKPLIRERLLYNLIYGLYANEAEAAAEAERLNFTLDSYILGIVENEIPKSDPENMQADETNLYQFGIISTLEEVLSDTYSTTCIALGSHLVAFLLTPKDGEPLSQEGIRSKCAYLQQIIRNCFNFTISIAVSSPGSGVKNLPEKLKECHAALEHKFYLGNNSIIFYEDLNKYSSQSDSSYLNERQKQLLENIKSGNMHAISENITGIFECINSAGGMDKELIRNFYFNTIMMIHAMKHTLPSESYNQLPENGLVSLYGMIKKCDNIADLSELLEKIAVREVEKAHEYNDNNMKLLLRKAVDYINAHYKDDLTLNQVAEHIYVSSFYISRMFKKELGINFVDYLNELRINKAKELLVDARYKTYEVAEAVGIPNAHYFSKLFKKYTGITASEFKESIKQ